VLDKGRVAEWSEDGKPLWVYGTHQDITEWRRIRYELEMALSDKDYLLKELNHRVKNNLRMVSSLVSLKDDALDNHVDLSDIRHQIDAIQIVHQKLHEGAEVTHINLRDYIGDLLATVFASFTGRTVSLENGIPDISIPTRAAVPIGLVTNELATNAIKHGFADHDDPRFVVSLRTGGEDYALTVSNTGRPFPEHVDFENPDSLGLQLIHALVSQLQGTIELQKTPVPVFTIRFPAEGME
jgi:two-component sensor histidine kinase